jgi:hypothetical protein
MTICLLIFSIPAIAHHGNAAFDNGKLMAVKGTVTTWVWANPHCFLKFDVKGENGALVHWSAELNNPPEMIRQGWSRDSLKVGDEITVTMIPAKNGNSIGRVQKVQLPNGQVLMAMAGIGNTRTDDSKPTDEPK